MPDPPLTQPFPDALPDVQQEWMESAQETLEILRDEERMSILSQSIRDIAEGNVIPWEQVKHELGLTI